MCHLERCVLDALERRALEPRVLCARRDTISICQRTSMRSPGRCSRILATSPGQLTCSSGVGSGTGDFVLLERASFHEIRGFNEVYRVARIGIDRNVIVKALASGFEIRDIGGPVYHQNHEGSYRLNPKAYEGRETEAPWGDRRWHSSGVSYVNPRRGAWPTRR